MKFEDYKASADYIKSVAKGFQPEIGIMLGTGLSHIADLIEDKIVIDYKNIPNFLQSTQKSHPNKLILGKLRGKNIVCMQGRFHYYEGYSFEELSIPVKILKLLGIQKLIVTNASGAVNCDFRPGDVMLISDHLNMCGISPTRGDTIKEFGDRFYDVSNAYDKKLIKIAMDVAKNSDIKVYKGVYHFFAGPQFETPAEIRASRCLGADVVGMSTIPEVLTACYLNIKTLGISLITNMAAGILNQKVTGQEVEETAKRVKDEFSTFFLDVVENI